MGLAVDDVVRDVDARRLDRGVQCGLAELLVRAALVELARAAELAPDETRFLLAYAVGLKDAERTPEALAAVDRALSRRPGDRTLAALRAQLLSPADSPGTEH